MQSLFYLVFVTQLLTFTYSQVPKVAPRAPKVAPKAPPKAPFLTFDPELATLDKDSTEGIFVATSLNKKPMGTVSIYLEGPNLIFSRCKVTFTTKNWDKQQIIKISPEPFLVQTPANSQMKAKFCYDGKKDTELHKSCQEYKVTRGKLGGGVCTTVGGVRYTPISGKLYIFRSVGSYYLLKSGPITIQQLNAPLLGGRVILQTKIALRYYKTVYIFEAQTRKAKLVSQTGDGVDLTEAPGVNSRVSLSDGTKLGVTYSGVQNNGYISFAVTLGRDYKGQLSGLCGDFGKPKHIMPNGLPAPNIKQLVTSWKVPDDDDLFSLGIRADSVVNSKNSRAIKKNECKIPDFDNINKDDKKATE